MYKYYDEGLDFFTMTQQRRQKRAAAQRARWQREREQALHDAEVAARLQRRKEADLECRVAMPATEADQDRFCHEAEGKSRVRDGSGTLAAASCVQAS